MNLSSIVLKKIKWECENTFYFFPELHFVDLFLRPGKILV